MTATLSAYASEQESLGFFRIFAKPPGASRREITLFRGAPVNATSVSFADPFTEQTAQLALPQVTVFDTPGVPNSDLDWLVPDCDIDIVFENTGDYDFDWRWEGYIASYSLSLSGASSAVTVDLKGALFALDNYLAMPTFPKRPIPLEILMAQDFDQTQHPCRLGKFQILWPEGWDTVVPEFKDPAYLAVLKPWGVATGKVWTGLTSRSTGSWEVMLTGHIQSMLTGMYASGGRQWSIRNIGHRRPQLFLRKIPRTDDGRIIEIQLGSPGVVFNGTRDFTQRVDVVYGQGSDTSGVSYDNVQVSPDGRTTYYQPFAWSPETYPRSPSNKLYDKSLTPKELHLRFTDGIDEVAAYKVAQATYERLVDPGITGDITLTTDPRYANGSICPRLLMKAGSTIRINGLLGVNEGVLAHITASTVDLKALTTQLTFDTKYRDALTVSEVQARSRDALTPLRMLQVGKYNNLITDSMLPWSYLAGSGMIPKDSVKFFTQILKSTDVFPYENITTNPKYSPSNSSARPWYIKLDKMDPNNANKNWTQTAIPIRMGQAGSIRLTQFAAYDKNGHVMKVKFHVSIYMGVGIVPSNMPAFPHDPAGGKKSNGDPDPKQPPLPYLKPRRPGDNDPTTHDRDMAVVPTKYTTGPVTTDNPDGIQHNPFYMQAWQDKQNNGYDWPWGSTAQMSTGGSEFVVGWGNYYEPAGYAPGLFSGGADRTGILEDTTPWTWDLVSASHIDPTSSHNNSLEAYAGMLFVMIYCDDNVDEPVFFMGRLVRAEQGTS